jgi:hypothetical protein
MHAKNTARIYNYYIASYDLSSENIVDDDKIDQILIFIISCYRSLYNYYHPASHLHEF